MGKIQDLPSGEPWPVIDSGDDVVVHDEEREWVEMGPGFEGSRMKVLWVDRDTNTTAWMYDMAPNSSFPMHQHVCRVIAYTISGSWWYDEREGLKTGTLIVEGTGSTHFPMSGPEGVKIFVVLQGDPDQPVLLRRQHPETLETMDVDIEYFVNGMKEASAAAS